MIFFETNINDSVLKFFIEERDLLLDFNKINALLKKICGINNFFTCQEEATELSQKIQENNSKVCESNRRAYGDFQTNEKLSQKVVEYISTKNQDFEFVLEPTCGKGNFILASIKKLKSLKKIIGVEIYQPYVWETKFKILEYFLFNKRKSKPEIEIIHANVFEFSFKEVAKSTAHFKTLVIGNPPWVTNSELGSINSKNLPRKSNFKKHNGLEAMTGKGNFDIGEFIALKMLKCFHFHEGIFAFLIKNSVVKNLIQEQKKNNFKISQSEKLNIDSKREFNVSVNASLFLTHFNGISSHICKELDFYTKALNTTFGWHKDKFVYSIENYDKSCVVEGKSIFTWRSGIKHDCSKVMELEQFNGHFKNGLDEEFKLENNLVYGLLKSSDLKKDKTNNYRKLTIITQNKIGQNTNYIEEKFPLTHQYLKEHKTYFDKRKSSIYRDKPSFSIFGIGDYSFAKYKVAISGLYKSTHFTLVSPKNSKAIMLDDTCYFIGFDNLKMAQIAHQLLNSNLVQNFLKSIIFSDSKRAINKDILMRIDFAKIIKFTNFENLKSQIENLKIEDWEEFCFIANGKQSKQLELF